LYTAAIRFIGWGVRLGKSTKIVDVSSILVYSNRLKKECPQLLARGFSYHLPGKPTNQFNEYLNKMCNLRITFNFIRKIYRQQLSLQ